MLTSLSDLAYLTFNLAKSYKILNHQELLIACSSIDIVSASISMSSSDNDILAARKLVITAHLVQAAAFVVEGLGLGLLSKVPLSTCATSWHPMFNYPGHWLVWTYFAVRLFICLSLVPTLYRLAARLHHAQNASKDGPHTLLAKEWELLPCTVMTNYLVFASITIPHVFAIFRIRAALGVQKSWEELWSQWGQSAAFVIAMATILHSSTLSLRSLAKANKNRVKVAKALNWNIKHDDSPSHWNVRSPWVTLVQRHPFPSSLRWSDELLTAKQQLLTVEERRLFLTEEQSNNLWNEVVQGIKLNDITGVLDSILRGASVNRKDEHGDTLLHTAARLGDEALLQAVCARAPQSLVLVDNGTSENALEIAIRANKLDAAKRILAEMRKNNNDDCRAALAKSFVLAIEAEKLSTLRILVTWPKWEELEASIPGEQPQNIFKFAIKNNKVQATKILLDYSASIAPSSPRIQTLFEYVLHNRQEAMATLLSTYRPSSVCNDCCLHASLLRGHSRILLSTGSDPNALMASAVGHGEWKTAGELLSQNISKEVLDYGLTTMRFGRVDIIMGTLPIEAALRARGGRSWQIFHSAAGEGDCGKLISMIRAEDDVDLVRRMVNSKTSSEFTLEHWNSTLHLLLNGEFRELKARDEMVECIDMLFSHGLTGSDQNSKGRTPLHFATAWYMSADIIRTICKEMPELDFNTVDVEGETVLHSLCWTYRLNFHAPQREHFSSRIHFVSASIDPITEALLHTMLPRSNPEDLRPEVIEFCKKLEYLRRHGSDPTITSCEGRLASYGISELQEIVLPLIVCSLHGNALQLEMQVNDIIAYLKSWEQEYETSRIVKPESHAPEQNGISGTAQTPQTYIGSSEQTSDFELDDLNLAPRYKWKGLRVEPAGEGDWNWISPSENDTS